MTIYRQFWVTYRKRLLVYSLLCVALATGNALFWLHKWHKQGVELCFADTMMTGVQPSFLLMLLIPPTLGLVHQLKFILEQPFVICALDNRSRLARNLLAALLFIAFRAVMAVSIPSIALGALLFRGSKPCTWESGASYYRFDYCGAEKDGWRNLVSPEIFESLNPLAKKPSQLSVGETEELAMAIGLHKDAFRNTEWSNLSTSDISLVMSVYPQKVILQSS